jgi:hypothetical protein
MMTAQQNDNGTSNTATQSESRNVSDISISNMTLILLRSPRPLRLQRLQCRFLGDINDGASELLFSQHFKQQRQAAMTSAAPHGSSRTTIIFQQPATSCCQRIQRLRFSNNAACIRSSSLSIHHQ